MYIMLNYKVHTVSRKTVCYKNKLFYIVHYYIPAGVQYIVKFHRKIKARILYNHNYVYN